AWPAVILTIGMVPGGDFMNRSATSLSGWSLLLLTLACQGSTTGPGPNPPSCDEATWPDPAQSPYVLPYAAGETHRTGLTNCSSSYRASGNPDQFAFDFDMPEGTPFIAARGGRVHSVVKQAPSEGGGTGNFVVIDHRDGTYGLYYHSPKNGISRSEERRVGKERRDDSARPETTLRG